MFGRLIGRIVVTVLCGTREGSFSLPEAGEEVGRALGDLLSSFKLSDDGGVLSGVVSRVGEVEEDIGVPTLTKEEAGLEELKRRLSEAKNEKKEVNDHTIDLISRSTRLFDVEGNFEYHIQPCPDPPTVEGLLWILGRLCGGNPHDKECICVSGTPYDGSACYQARNVADVESDSFFWSDAESNRWVSYDFKNLRVAATHYVLRSNGNGPGNRHLRSWVLEVSENGRDWRVIDRREEDGSLNDCNKVRSFELRTIVETRFIRLRQTGVNWQGDHYLYFTAFELFGGLRVPESLKLT
jgi:hypothetical protein